MAQISNGDIGKTVSFDEWDERGKPVVLRGVVIDEFREPRDEDPYQRLNYVVRTEDGKVYTPYASECWGV